MVPHLLLLAFLALLASCSLPGALGNDGHFPENVPSPMLYPRSCNRDAVARSAVCDLDDMLPDDEKNVLEGMINEIGDRQATTGKGQGQLAVCYIYKMAKTFTSQYDGDIDKSAKEFAHQVHDRWGVGDTKKQDGVLLFVSIHDRVVYITTGSGVESLFPPAVVTGVVDHMKPYLQNKHYSGALESAVTEIGLVLQGKPLPAAKREYPYYKSESYHSSSESGSTNEALIVFGVFAAISAIVVLVARTQSNTQQVSVHVHIYIYPPPPPPRPLKDLLASKSSGVTWGSPSEPCPGQKGVISLI